MQFSIVALAAFVATAAAQSGAVAYTTEVVTAYTTVCPAAAEITHNEVTYTVTAGETLTVTNCPCTVVKPVTTSSIVICHTCAPSPPPVYGNSSSIAPTGGLPQTTTTYPGAPGTTVVPVGPSATASTPPIEANTGNRAFAFSGASLAALLGLAAWVL